MGKAKIREKWLRLSVETNALDYLEQAYHYIRQTETTAIAWKWVVLALHGALYGFAICACKGTNPDRVVDFNKKSKIFEKLDTLPNEIKGKGFPEDIDIKYDSPKKRLVFKGAMSGEERESLVGLSESTLYKEAVNSLFMRSRKLISFNKALERCQDPNRMHMTVISRHLHLSDRQKESIRKLKHVFRNNFEHYMPKAWSIEIHGMPQIAIDVLEVIRFLALDTGNYINLTQAQTKRVKSIVFQSKRILKQSLLYKEFKAVEKMADG